MKTGLDGHLNLNIAEFETRFDDGVVPPSPVRRVRQDALQAGAVGEALNAGD